jgi:hypothetical protein
MGLFRRVVVPVLLAALLAAGTAGCAGDGGGGRTGSDGTTGRTSTPDPTPPPAATRPPVGGQPQATPPAAGGGAPSPPPGLPKTVDPKSGPRLTLTGTVTEGVERGCLLLEGYLLINGPADVVRAGVKVRVTGTVRTDLVSTCQQGTPFMVSSATRA